jgi:octaprenyl-diphosphate synthase
LAEYGHELGMAFQLVDDLIDYQSSPDVSGKNLGNDLAEGKPTLPLIHAMKHGSREQAELIRKAIQEARLDELAGVLAAVESTGAIHYTAALASRHADAAIAALSGVPDSPYKDALTQLARFAVERVH